jgi:hypothetical protein
MTDFTRLSTDWVNWSNWMRKSNVSVSISNEHETCFKSDDGTFEVPEVSRTVTPK